MKTAFIGHRKIFAPNLYDKLVDIAKIQIQKGCQCFTMGTHGEFDRLALAACRSLRRQYKNIEIEAVLTSLHIIETNNEWDELPYSDVKTVIYEIEKEHYKRQITLSNRMMIDTCDTLICYVDSNSYRSGAKTAMRYAEKQGLNIINLYRKQDLPFYGMTKEEIDTYMKTAFDKLSDKKL